MIDAQRDTDTNAEISNKSNKRRRVIDAQRDTDTNAERYTRRITENNYNK